MAGETRPFCVVQTINPDTQMITPVALLAVQLAAQSAPAIANPASTYCLSIGGRLEMVTTAKGQIGICILKDGRRIEEWRLFRRAQKQKSRSQTQP